MESNDEDHLFYACQDASSNKGNKRWLIDSGCTSHMTYDREIFIDLDTSVKIPVRMGNRAVVESQGKETIQIDSKKVLSL